MKAFCIKHIRLRISFMVYSDTQKEESSELCHRIKNTFSLFSIHTIVWTSVTWILIAEAVCRLLATKRRSTWFQPQLWKLYSIFSSMAFLGVSPTSSENFWSIPSPSWREPKYQVFEQKKLGAPWTPRNYSAYPTYCINCSFKKYIFS